MAERIDGAIKTTVRAWATRSAHVTVPKEWIGKEVFVILTEKHKPEKILGKRVIIIELE